MKRRPPKILLIILVILILPLTLIFCTQKQQKRPFTVSKAGVLDLRGWEPEKGVPSLNGEWEFYWQELLSEKDFTSGIKQKETVLVPDTWNKYHWNGKKLPGFGYATYRVRILVDDLKQPLSLRMDNASTAYRLLINDQEIMKNGTVGKNRKASAAWMQPETATFMPPAKSFDLIIQVSNFEYARGGLWYEVRIGAPEQVAGQNVFLMYKDAILIGGLLIMALFFTGFCVRLKGDNSSRYFVLLCIIFIIRTALYGDSFLLRIFPKIPFRVVIILTYVTLYWIPITVTLVISHILNNKVMLIGNEKSEKSSREKYFIYYGIIMTVMTVLLPISVFTSFVSVIELIGVAMIFFSLLFSIRSYLKGVRWAGMIFCAVYIIMITGIHDVLYQANIIDSAQGEFASIGIFFFMFILSFIIAGRFSDAYEQSRELTRQLQVSLNRERKVSQELVQSEMNFLKAQIKPHFLHNTLSVIAALITENPAKAETVLYDLSDYLRGSFQFDNQSGVITFSEELRIVRAYLAIEAARFEDSFCVSYELDEKTDSKIPMLLIQPLVENALRHGILPSGKKGKLTIRSRQKVGVLLIEIEDDGVGMSQEKLIELRNGTSPERGVGIKNIRQRLQLLGQSDLKIESLPGQGTRIIIELKQE